VWHYRQNEQELGPVSLDELRTLASAGQLAPTDLVWLEGTPRWVPAGSVPRIFPNQPRRLAPKTMLATPRVGSDLEINLNQLGPAAVPRPILERPPAGAPPKSGSDEELESELVIDLDRISPAPAPVPASGVPPGAPPATSGLNE